MTEKEDESNKPNNEENSTDENEETNDSSDNYTAEDSTGVNPEAEEPIDPKMPNMPPA